MANLTSHASRTFHAVPFTDNVWYRLVWKELRQVGQLLVGIVVIQACVQLMLGWLEMMFPQEMPSLSLNAINIALASPTLMALACCGVLIGQERQNGCWNWSSSLPVSWTQSLLSKVLVWFTASVAAVLLLLMVASIPLSINHSQVAFGFTGSSQNIESWTYLMTLIIGVQAFVYLSISTLLFRDTLVAIAIATFAMLFFHCQVAVFNLVAISNLGYRQNHDWIILLSYCISFVVGAVALAFTYRWRWGTGQYGALVGFGNGTGSDLRPQPAIWRAYASSARQPSESWMLLQHGLRTAFNFRFLVFCSTLLLIGTRLTDFAVVLSACLFGVSVFSGDQTLNRYRFFSDRGVSWGKLLVGHAWVPASLTLVIAIYASIVTVQAPNVWVSPLNAWIYCLCVPAFLIGMYSSLVFASPLVAITVAIAGAVLSFAFTGFALSVWSIVAPGYAFAVIAWIPVSTFLVLWAVIWVIPKWLQSDRLDATGRYFCSMFVAGLLPCAAGLSLGFLCIPRVNWQGMPFDQIPPINWEGGPDLEMRQSSYETNFRDQAYARRARTVPVVMENSQLSSRIFQLCQAGLENTPNWLNVQQSALRAIENGGAEPDKFDSVALQSLNRLIERSAVTALLATKQRQKDVAIRAWKANRKLIAFCQQPALLPATLPTSMFVWEVWNTLDDADLQFLGDTEVLQQLAPVPRSSLEQVRTALRARATLQSMFASGDSRGDNYRFSYTWYLWPRSTNLYYAPLRWANERQIAFSLSHDLSLVNQAGTTQVISGFNSYASDPLVYDYLILADLERCFSDRLKRLKESSSSEEP